MTAGHRVLWVIDTSLRFDVQSRTTWGSAAVSVWKPALRSTPEFA